MTGLAARAAGLRRNAEGPEDEPGTARDPDCRGAWPGARQRAFDLAAIALLSVALAPLWLVLGVAIAAAIRLEGSGPVLYRQERLGRGGRVFRMLKFRSMVEDAERHTGPVAMTLGL